MAATKQLSRPRSAGARVEDDGDGFGQAQVARIQRARMLSAMFEGLERAGRGERERRACRRALRCLAPHVL